MSNKVLSIEIGQQTAKVCEVDYLKKYPHVYNCMEFNIPGGLIDDGYIRDKVAFAAVLKENLVKHNMNHDKVVFTIASTKIASREVLIPLVNDKRIHDIIMANATDYFPVNISEFNLTYSILEKINNKEEKQIRLMVLAAPNNLIQSYYELADLLKLSIMSIDYVGNSSFQLLRNQFDSNINMVVQINENNTLINILEHDFLLLQRIIPYGVDSVVEEVISHPILSADNKADAMQLLCSETYINKQFDSMEEDFTAFIAASNEYNEKMEFENARDELTNSFQNLVNNMVRVMDYFTTKNPKKKVACIYITGEGSGVLGLETLIHNEMGVEVKIHKTLQNISFGKQVKKDQNECIYIAAIGAAIAPVDFTNQLNTIRKKNGDSLAFPLIILVLCIVGSVGICLSSYLLYQNTIEQKAELETKIAAIKSIEEVKLEEKELTNQVANLNIFDTITANKNDDLVAFLEEVQDKIPTDSLITSMSITTTDVTINVTAKSKTSVSKFILELESSERIANVAVNSISDEEQDGASNEVTYAVVCTYR